MIAQHDSFEFDALGGRYVISRRGPVDAIDGDRAAGMILDLVRRDQRFRSSLARWALRESVMWSVGDEIKIVDELVRSIRFGMIRVHAKAVTRRTYVHSYLDAPVQADEPSVVAQGEQVVETPRSLLITHCPPQFDPRVGPLRISYLLRDLHGHPVELVIRSEAHPEPAVHRRMLAPAETVDGPSKLEWDGKDDSSGEFVGRDAAPFIVELVHDATYRDQSTTTLPAAALVHIVEMEDLMFATNRAIFMPDGGFDEGAEDEQNRATGLHAIAAVLRHAAFHPGHKLGIFGHTDTVGSNADNLQLSSDRATNIQCVLTGDAESWANHCASRYEVADFQRVLKWIAISKEWPTDPGPIDNQFGNTTRTARANFRSLMNEHYGTSLEQGVKQSIDDWKAYFTLFDEAVCRILGVCSADLEQMRNALDFTNPATVGCGEAFPADQPGLNSLESAANRRVDVVFFEPHEIPQLPGDPPGEPLYASMDYKARYLPIGKDGGTVSALLRLLDGDDLLGGTQYVIERGDELLDSGVTEADGTIFIELPQDVPGIVLRLPALGRIFVLDAAGLPPLSDTAGAQGRLSNLGYLCPISGQFDDTTKEALLAFQRDLNLPPTGELDGLTRTALRDAHDVY